MLGLLGNWITRSFLLLSLYSGISKVKNIIQGSVVDDGIVYQACAYWPSKVRNKRGEYAQQGSTTSDE